jgi:hypothetical protein
MYEVSSGTVIADRRTRQFSMVDLVAVSVSTPVPETVDPSSAMGTSTTQPWELQQLHVVQWQFLEKQKLTGSSLSVWHKSRLFVGLNTHFPPLFVVYYESMKRKLI